MCHYRGVLSLTNDGDMGDTHMDDIGGITGQSPSPVKWLCRATAIIVEEHLMGSAAVSLNTVLEYVDQLDIEDELYLMEIIHRRLIDAKRPALVHRVKQAKGSVRKNQ